MIIDAHSHLKHGDAFFREVPAAEIIAGMDEAGIDRACVFVVRLPAYLSSEHTRKAVAACDRLIPFAHLLVEEGVAAHQELDRAIGVLGFKGLKLHCGEVRGEVTPELFIPFLEQAAGYQLPIIFDAVNRPEFTEACARAVPEARLIVAHLGSGNDQFMNDRFIDLAYRNGNVWLDLSYCNSPWKIADAFRVLGPDKLIWGSDGGGSYYPPIIELTKTRAYIRDEEALKRILGGNIARLLAEVKPN